jgi:signal transduction histidine kinase
VLDNLIANALTRGGAGSGLGVAIVDAIARAHGREAHAHDAADAGAVAGLTLPAA